MSRGQDQAMHWLLKKLSNLWSDIDIGTILRRTDLNHVAIWKPSFHSKNNAYTGKESHISRKVIENWKAYVNKADLAEDGKVPWLPR